jgi:hypothetical protein
MLYMCVPKIGVGYSFTLIYISDKLITKCESEDCLSSVEKFFKFHGTCPSCRLTHTHTHTQIYIYIYICFFFEFLIYENGGNKLCRNTGN